MNSLKQRIIGALVLISLAVIFLPMLFDRPHQNRESQIIAIPVTPEKPVVDFESVETPSYEILDESGDAVQEPAQSVSTSAAIEPTNSPSVPQVAELATEPQTLAAEKKEKKLIVEPVTTQNTVTVKKETTKPVAAAPPKVTSLPTTSTAKRHTPEVQQLALFKKGILIQVGTFSSKTNALALRKKLIDMGLDGHVAIFKNSEGKTLWQVFSGPYVDKNRALKDQAIIDKKFKVKSFIKRF